MYENIRANLIRYEHPRTPTYDHKHYHDTTMNDPDPAMVELQFRPDWADPKKKDF